MALTASGQETIPSVDIDIERPDMPASIASALRRFIFSMEGENNSLTSRRCTTAPSCGSRLVEVSCARLARTSLRSTCGYLTAIGEAKPRSSRRPDLTWRFVPLDPGSCRQSIFTISTRNLDFGSQAIGTRSARRITITNHSVRTVKIKAIHTGGDFSETNTCLSAGPMAPGASCEVTATFQPSATGIRIGAIGIDSDVHLIPVVLNLTGTGSKP
jgi:hypothetical protein